MIFKANEQQNGSESSSGKAGLAAEDRRAALEVPLDAPPPYTASAGPLSTAGPSSSVAGPSRTTVPSHPTSCPSSSTPAVQRTNFVSIDRRDGSIKENYILDPTVIIPEALLPPLSGSLLDPAVIIPEALKMFPALGPLGLDLLQKNVKPRTRKNLSLQAQYSGIETEITIPQVDPEVFQEKMTLYLSAPYGTIKCRIRRPTTYPAFALELTADHGGIRLILPRSFHGPLSTKTSYGSVKLSDGITSNHTLFSETQGEKKYFIGDATGYLDHLRLGTEWEGDEVKISSGYGKVKIIYEDEFEERNKKGFWAGLFDEWMF